MSSLPDGVTIRSLRHDDAALVAELLVEYERAPATNRLSASRTFAAWWLRTNLDEDSWLLEEAGTALAGGWLDRLDDFAFAGAAVRPRRWAAGSGPGSSSTSRITPARTGFSSCAR